MIITRPQLSVFPSRHCHLQIYQVVCRHDGSCHSMKKNVHLSYCRYLHQWHSHSRKGPLAFLHGHWLGFALLTTRFVSRRRHATWNGAIFLVSESSPAPLNNGRKQADDQDTYAHRERTFNPNVKCQCGIHGASGGDEQTNRYGQDHSPDWYFTYRPNVGSWLASGSLRTSLFTPSMWCSYKRQRDLLRT